MIVTETSTADFASEGSQRRPVLCWCTGIEVAVHCRRSRTDGLLCHAQTATAAANMIAYPFDTVRRRLMMQARSHCTLAVTLETNIRYII